MFTAQKKFEIWQTVGECIATTVFTAGPESDQIRTMVTAEGAKQVHVFAAYSELDCSQKYYDFMDFGIYHSEWPDLAIRPYHFVDGLKNREKLKKPLFEMRHIMIFADGSTRPNIPDPLPLFKVQDRAVFAVGIWIRGEFGGHMETPTNEAKLIGLIEAHLQKTAPEHLTHFQSAAFICPLQFAELMEWPLDGRDPAESATP